MLTLSDLKFQLHRKDLKQLDKLLVILAASDEPLKPKEIQDKARLAGLNISGWNLTTIFSRSVNLAIRTPDGWELGDEGKLHLDKLGIPMTSAATRQVSQELRAALQKITNADTRNFVEEAILCFEYKQYRSAVIMSWVGAIHILYTHIHLNNLTVFNAEASRVDLKWKTAKTIDDLALMKESDFLDRLSALSIIGKSVKTELVRCLNLRNGCGHPNSMKIGPSAVAHHIETLLLNVYAVFAN